MRETSWTGERRAPEHRSGVRPRGAWFKAMLLIAVVAIAALGLETFGNRESYGEDVTVLPAPPEELVGMWVTENPRYAGSALVIGPDHIEIDPGEAGGVRSHPILLIRAVQSPNRWTYEIDYGSPGFERTVTVNLHPDGVLRLRNPPDLVWRRKPTSEDP